MAHRRSALLPAGEARVIDPDVWCYEGPWLWRVCRWLILVAPRHPSAGILCKLGGISQESCEVLEGVYAHEITRVDKAHEKVSHPGSPLGLVEKGVAPVSNGHLQGPFTNVVIDCGAGDLKEESESFPALEHVLDRISHAGVGLDPFFIELCFHPAF